MKELSRAKNQLETSGQVLLETAIVLISIAVLAIGSMALFSNLKLNLISRQKVFRDSRVEAVNASNYNYPPGNSLSPRTYLEYSPNYSLTVPSSTIILPVVEYFEEPRIQAANLLFQTAGEDTSVVIPSLIPKIYQDLGGDSVKNDLDIAKIPSEDVAKALVLTNQLTDAIREAYNYPYEDMYAKDKDNDGFIGGVGLEQDVLNKPTQGGPYDTDLDCPEADKECLATEKYNQGSYDQLAINVKNYQTINEPYARMSLIFNPFLVVINGNRISPALLPLAQHIQYDLTNALSNWNGCKQGDALLCIELWRVYYIRDARAILKFMLDAGMGSEVVPPAGGLDEQINSVYDLLSSDPVTQDDAIKARDLTNEMLAREDVQDPKNSVLQSSLLELQADLNNALANWDDEQKRQYYLDRALIQAEALHEVVNVE